MNRRLIAIVFVSAFALSSGCAKRAGRRRQTGISAFARRTTDTQRFIAVRHKLQIVARIVIAQCLTIGNQPCSRIHCEILKSSITARSRQSSPSAAVTLRCGTRRCAEVNGPLAKTVQHHAAHHRKTSAVVDTDAKIKNLTGFRDNLRGMLAKPSATVKDSGGDSAATDRSTVATGQRNRPENNSRERNRKDRNGNLFPD
jgi:hypothetical protein